MSNILPVFRIIKPGIFCAFQDLGRFGYRHLGVPWSGAMDRLSYLFVNQKLGNNTSDTVLEVMGSGLVLEVMVDVTLFWSGADTEIGIDEMKLYNISNPVEIKKGQTITVKKQTKGIWTYLGIKHGFDVQKVMGSASSLKGTHLGLLQKNDIIYRKPLSLQNMHFSSLRPNSLDSMPELKVFKGPEFGWLTDIHVEIIKKSNFVVTKDYSRMGYRLFGPEVRLSNEKECITSPVMPGTVQLLPNGQMIVLMRECQITGGYPRVFQLDEPSISKLAQKRLGDPVKFVY